MKKKMIVALFLASLMLLLIVTNAFASTTLTVTGYTAGGGYGKVKCTGTLEYANSTSAGGDRVTAKTKSAIDESRNWVQAKIYFAQGSGNSSRSSTGSGNGTSYASATVKPTAEGHGYKGTSSHVVNTDNYGGWTDSQSATW